VFRRLFANPESASDRPDTLEAVERLLRLHRSSDRAAEVLRVLCTSLAGEVRGYVVRGTEPGTYVFDATQGYSPSLLALTPVHGPWRESGPRVVPNLISELFTPNDGALRGAFGELGMRNATSGLVVPVAGRFLRYGTLILQRHGDPAFSDEEMRLAARWGAVLGEAQSQAFELRRAKLSLVEFTKAFVQAMEAQDFAQLGHADRVTAYALALGRALELTNAEQADLYFAAMLHDIGKLGAGLDLSIEDIEHPQRGANLVASASLLRSAAEGIRTHHENWDGSGFPGALRKEQIPLLGRIVAMADTFDVLSSERGQAMPMREVERALEARSGRELDPSLVQLFINVLRQGKSTADLARLEESDLPF
jgi:HD-GYP domain-containing protein (c-di-GMP phosphodiesterase class II)